MLLLEGSEDVQIWLSNRVGAHEAGRLGRRLLAVEAVPFDSDFDFATNALFRISIKSLVRVLETLPESIVSVDCLTCVVRKHKCAMRLKRVCRDDYQSNEKYETASVTSELLRSKSCFIFACSGRIEIYTVTATSE